MSTADAVKDYLDRRASSEDRKYKRVECCNSSRYLYCPECCQVLVPKPNRPPSFTLPFNLDIVLDDRRGSSTGIHAKALAPSCNLYDLDRGDKVPDSYDAKDTYLLFPVTGESIPIADVANNIDFLVVLDCKWTKSSSKNLPGLQKLQKVHLSKPPLKSYFWRWHNEGKGMLSTIEAIYYASLEVAEHKNNYPSEHQDNLIHLLWLFAEQRASIENASKKNGTVLPFSEAGKEQQRALRRYEGTAKQARDKEVGRRLKEKARLEREERKKTESLSKLSDMLEGTKI